MPVYVTDDTGPIEVNCPVDTQCDDTTVVQRNRTTRRSPAGWLVFLTLIFGSLLGGEVNANGWAHASIPFKALLTGLTVADTTTRARSAQFLGLRGRVEAVEPLIALLQRGEDAPEVRSATYTALGRLGHHSGVRVLNGCLTHEERAELRADCVLALGNLGQHGTLDTLLQTFQTDTSILVRSRVVEALGLFEDPEAVEVLSHIVMEGPNPSLRFRAIRALGRSASPHGSRALLFALDSPLSDDELLLTVAALSRVAPPEAAASLRKLLSATDSPRLRVQITVTLGAIDDGAALDTLTGLLGDDVPAVRYYAVDGLLTLRDPAAAPPLRKFSIELVQDLDNRLRHLETTNSAALILDLHLLTIAQRALEAIDPVQAKPVFMAAAQLPEISLDSSVDAKVAEAIYECRRLAVYSLGYTKSPDAAAVLFGSNGLGHYDFRIRAVAARSLAVLGSAGASRALGEMLTDESAEVRWTAALGLGRLSATSEVPLLIELLSDPTAKVRAQASLSLGYIGDNRARAALTHLSEVESNTRVRAAADLALGILDEKNATD